MATWTRKRPSFFIRDILQPELEFRPFAGIVDRDKWRQEILGVLTETVETESQVRDQGQKTITGHGDGRPNDDGGLGSGPEGEGRGGTSDDRPRDVKLGDMRRNSGKTSPRDGLRSGRKGAGEDCSRLVGCLNGARTAGDATRPAGCPSAAITTSALPLKVSADRTTAITTTTASVVVLTGGGGKLVVAESRPEATRSGDREKCPPSGRSSTVACDLHRPGVCPTSTATLRDGNAFKTLPIDDETCGRRSPADSDDGKRRTEGKNEDIDNRNGSGFRRLRCSPGKDNEFLPVSSTHSSIQALQSAPSVWPRPSLYPPPLLSSQQLSTTSLPFNSNLLSPRLGSGILNTDRFAVCWEDTTSTKVNAERPATANEERGIEISRKRKERVEKGRPKSADKEDTDGEKGTSSDEQIVRVQETREDGRNGHPAGQTRPGRVVISRDELWSKRRGRDRQTAACCTQEERRSVVRADGLLFGGPPLDGRPEGAVPGGLVPLPADHPAVLHGEVPGGFPDPTARYFLDTGLGRPLPGTEPSYFPYPLPHTTGHDPGRPLPVRDEGHLLPMVSRALAQEEGPPGALVRCNGCGLHESPAISHLQGGLSFINNGPPPPPGQQIGRPNSLPVPIPLPVYLRTRASPNSDGSSRPRKCRRSRTVFSELQLMGLERRFDDQKYLSTPDRAELARTLGLSQVQVKTWYQNRRMKWKKQVLQGGATEAPTKPKGRPRKEPVVAIETGDESSPGANLQKMTSEEPTVQNEALSDCESDIESDEDSDLDI